MAGPRRATPVGTSSRVLVLAALALAAGTRAAAACDEPWDPRDTTLTRSSSDGVEWVSEEHAWAMPAAAAAAGGGDGAVIDDALVLDDDEDAADGDDWPASRAPASSSAGGRHLQAPARTRGAGGDSNRTAPVQPYAGRRGAFLNYFHSRCITFMGDSVSREMHFNLLLFAFGCATHNSGQRLRGSEVRKRFEPRGVNVSDRCSFFRQHMKDRSNRVTRVPVDADPAHDVIVRFIWARYMDELNKRSQLSAMLDMDACDVYVLNAGFWHLRLPRTERADVHNVSGQLRGLVEGLRWGSSRGRRDLIRRRLVWRSSTLIELEVGMFTNQQLHRLNQRLDGQARSYGLPVYNYEELFAGAAPAERFKFTADGYHPTVKLHLAMLADMFTGIYLAQRDSWYRWEGSGDGLTEADFKPRQRHFFILPPKDAAEAARRENEAAAAEALQRRIRRRQRLFATPTPRLAPAKPQQPLPKKPAPGREDEGGEDEAPLVQLDSAASQKKQARDAAVQAAVASLVPRIKDSDKQRAAQGGGKRHGGGGASPRPSLAEGARAGSGARGGNSSNSSTGGGDDDEVATEGGDDDTADSSLDDGERPFKYGLLGASVRAIRDQLVPRLRLANDSVSSALAQSSYLVLLSLVLPLAVVVAWAGRRSRSFPTLVGAAGGAWWGGAPPGGGPAAGRAAGPVGTG